MTWKNILKNDNGHKRVLEMARKVLRELGLEEKLIDDRASELANSDKLFRHIPFSFNNLRFQVESEEEMYSKVDEQSLKDMVMADRGFYLPNLLNQEERFKQRKKEDWDESGHEILMELDAALKEGVSLPKWAVVKDGELDERATKEKYINEATKDFDDSNSIHWSIGN